MENRPRARYIIFRCRATIRGIKLEIGESSYRKSANRSVAAVRYEKAGAETAIPATSEAFPLQILRVRETVSPVDPAGWPTRPTRTNSYVHACGILRTMTSSTLSVVKQQPQLPLPSPPLSLNGIHVPTSTGVQKLIRS